jgi:excisionase family DNA binding protein
VTEHVGMLSPEAVARLVGLSRKAVYRGIERGELPASRLCSRLRIRREDVDIWIERNRVAADPSPLANSAHSGLPRRRRALPARGGLRTLLAESEEGRKP